MTIHRIALAAAVLLMGATPMAHAGNGHVDISVNLGYLLPVHMGYREQMAPVVIRPPMPAIYYSPVYAAPSHYYYRDDRYYDRHERWHHRNEHQQYRQHVQGGDYDRDDDRDRGGKRGRHRD